MTIGKDKTIHKNQENFIAYLFKSTKVMCKDIVISIFFIISSSSEPIFSIKNGAVWVLLWYIISFLLLILICYFNVMYNEKSKQKKKWHRRHGYDETITEKQKNEIKWFKKANIELGGWTFVAAKLVTALLFMSIISAISVMRQSFNYENYMENEKNFFTGLFFDTLAITVVGAYYSISVDEASKTRGMKNKVYAIWNLFKGRLITKIFFLLTFLAILVLTVIYSFNEFTLFSPILLGISYVVFSFIPIKDATVK